MTQTRPRVLLIDDHRVVAEGLVRLLSERAEIVETLSDGRQALEAVRRVRPDVLIVDISMPHMSGLEVLRRLRQQGIDVKTIVLTMFADPGIAVEALEAGASAFVLKEASGDELLDAIRVVLDGGTYLSADLTKDVVTRMVEGDPREVELTVRQQEVLRMIVRGLRAKEIASALDMPTRTVETVKYRMMQLLNVHSTAELVRYAVERGLISR
jgi:DNA-binding NarL/FixJ family response regulator